MTNREAHPDIPEQQNVREEVFRIFAEMRSDNSEYVQALASKLWTQLPPEERDAKQTLVKDMLPESDLVTIGESSKALVLLEYLTGQVELAEQLNNQFAQPSPETPTAA